MLAARLFCGLLALTSLSFGQGITVTGSTTAGSAVITNVSPPVNNPIGLYLIQGPFADGTTITAAMGSQLTMSSNATATQSHATLVFSSSPAVNLDVVASPPGSGSVAISPSSANGKYAKGTSIQLTATAASGYAFIDWGGVTGSANPVTFILNSDLSVTAFFNDFDGITLSCSPSSGPTKVGVAYSSTCTASSGNTPYTLSVLGTLPNGITSSMTANSVTISGTPTTAGPYNYSVQVLDGWDETAKKTFSGTIAAASTPGPSLSCTNNSGPSQTGIAYSSKCTASGGTSPYSFSTTGSLPAGLSVSSNATSATISGTPTATGPYNYAVKVTDNNSQTDTVSFSGTIQSPSTFSISSALAHFAAGDTWTTGFYIINTSAQSAQYAIAFYADDGSPATLPFDSGSANQLAGTLAGNGSAYFEAGDKNAQLVSGSAQISADPAIVVQALFRNSVNGTFYEAAVPSSPPGSHEFLIPFDATTFAANGAPTYTGFAIANASNTNAAVTCTARDPGGVVIPGAITVPTLNPSGHWANYLFPALTGMRGTIDCVSNANIVATALRVIGTTAFSSLPVIFK